MKNSEIAAVFDEIAALLEKKKENRFKIRAYQNAAATILDMPQPVEQLAAEDRLREIPGVGEAISKKIAELVGTGKLEYLEKLRAGMAVKNDG